MNNRMGYSLKDLWQLKEEKVIYAGRSRQGPSYIKGNMARTKKAKGMRPSTALKRELKQEIKKDEKALVKSISKAMHSSKEHKNG